MNAPATRVYSGEDVGPDLFPARRRAAVRVQIQTLKLDRSLALGRGDHDEANRIARRIAHLIAVVQSDNGDHRAIRKLAEARHA